MLSTPTALILTAVVAVGGTASAQSGQATRLRADFRFGQTFLTFLEASVTRLPDAYHVYRSGGPIRTARDLQQATLLARVPTGSYWNKRAQRPFLLRQGGTPLQKGVGFVALTAQRTRFSYYAVVAVNGLVENRWIATGSKGNVVGPVFETPQRPRPVLQSVDASGRDYHYVHFLSEHAVGSLAPQTNRAGCALNYRVWVDGTTKGPRPVYIFLHSRGGNYKTAPLLSWVEPNGVQLFLDDDNPPELHTSWFGFHENFTFGPPSGVVRDYSERRILWSLDEILNDATIQADRQRCYCFGVSLGAMGALGLGTRYPDVFAATGGVVPAFSLQHSDFALKVEFARLFGSAKQNLRTNLPSGERFYDVFDYASQMRARERTGVAPMFFTAGRGDTVTGWNDKPAFFRSTRRARQPVACYWDWRTHSSSGVWSPLERDLFRELTQIRLDRPLPVLSNLVLDDDPGNGNRLKGAYAGAIGGYTRFDPRTPSETATKVTVDVGLKGNAARRDYAVKPAATADLTWRRLRVFRPRSGVVYRVRTRELHQTQIREERLVTVDRLGLLTVPKLRLTRTLRRVELEPTAVTLPAAHLGGDVEPGGTLALSLLAKPGQIGFLALGGVEGAIKLSIGTWRLLDGAVIWAGVIPANQHMELVVDLPNLRALSGLRILAQGFAMGRVGPGRLSGLAAVRIR